MNHCQDGILVYFETEIPQYPYFPFYGHYELQTGTVNGRSYFKMTWVTIFLYWDGIDSWRFGPLGALGQSGVVMGFAFNQKDVFCPYQLFEWDWIFAGMQGVIPAEHNLGITCKCNV